MEQNKQTAVEWLVNQLFFSDQKKKFEKQIEQAKEMEKQQIIDAYDDGTNERHNEPVNGEEYYNEEYGKGNNEQ